MLLKKYISWLPIWVLAKIGNPPPLRVEKVEIEWKSILIAEQYFVLRYEATESSHSLQLYEQFEPGGLKFCINACSPKKIISFNKLNFYDSAA